MEYCCYFFHDIFENSLFALGHGTVCRSCSTKNDYSCATHYLGVICYIEFILKEYILGISQRRSSKDELNQEEIELESNNEGWSIGKLINDIQFFKKDTFENCYKRYHSEKDLETLFENAHNVLVNNKSITEGVDFKQLEEVMDTC